MEFRILGPLEVVASVGPVDLGPPKQRALLAALLLHPNEIVPADELIEWLWSGDPPRTANHSIQIYVSELRKVLANGQTPVIETRPPGYLLRTSADSIDAARFEALVEEASAMVRSANLLAGAEMLRAALGLWRGRPLSDFAYEEFSQPHIRRLDELWARAVEELTEAELAIGYAKSALPLLHQLVERAPLAETPRRLLMLALYRSGRQADALRAYREFRRLLGEELGVEPSGELQRLEEMILLQDPALDPPPSAIDVGQRPHVGARNPFKGLRAFDESDAADFFGRDSLITQLVDLQRRRERLQAVVGPSGSGKSSLVRAGLIPQLRAGEVSGSEMWLVATMMPGRHPFEELEAVLHRAAGRRGIEFDTGDTGLLRAALRLLPEDGSELVLVVDQFEELFTLVDEHTRRRFLRALVAAVEGPHSRVRVILTLRADFYDRPLVYPGFAPLFVGGAVTVTPLKVEDLEAAVREPSAQVGVDVEGALLAQIVSDMFEQPGALPLLQFTLTELFDARDGSQLTLEEYRQLGGLQGALTRRAEQIYSEITEEQREMARQLFLRLVRVDRGGQSTRRRVALSDVRAMGPKDGSIDEVIARLGSERLLVFDRDLTTGGATVEVTHEALVSSWPRLRDWVEDHRSDL